MKTTTFDPAIIGTDEANSSAGLWSPVRRVIDAIRLVRVERAMRAELAELDALVLRDIGVADDEIPRVKCREPFTPRAWRD